MKRYVSLLFCVFLLQACESESTSEAASPGEVMAKVDSEVKPASALVDVPSYPPDKPPENSKREDLENPHVLVFNASVPPEMVYTEIRVELQRLDETREITLLDDGTSPEDAPYDGVFSGRDVGEKTRYVQVTLISKDTKDQEETLYAGLVRTENRRLTTVSFQVGKHPWGRTAYLVASAYPGSSSRIAEGLPLIAAFGWTALLIVYVGMLVKRRA
jgi:hypothetical protein